ncbi:uncharacterized protein LOC131471691 isoform X2 [Solea solea]|nr:uncharacterized protein LOC131471691 isoform X2 [Solea solea]XP_058504362.1 uncharacterized protein LOC131471691 isoform X2 [Solea solea]XP_058504363.1 uncharacterized protein LOC131471691 isoform X2 [Solea solea]
MFPPLCQILKDICHRPGCCCSLYQEQIQTIVTTTLGTVQIMVGVFNIGLGPGRTSTHPGDVTSLGAAYWLAAVFIVTGILSILAGQFPSSCLMGFSVFMNISAAVFAITGFALYVVDVRDASLLWMCDDKGDDICRKLALIAQSLLRCMDITLIAFTVLQLFINVQFAIMGIKDLTREKEEEHEQNIDDQQLKLEELVMTSPGASHYFK